jgi:hypothetical protein
MQVPERKKERRSNHDRKLLAMETRLATHVCDALHFLSLGRFQPVLLATLSFGLARLFFQLAQMLERLFQLQTTRKQWRG